MRTIGLFFGWIAIISAVFLVSAIIYLIWTYHQDGKCEHINVRCVHGDEIIHSGFRRGRCLDCCRYLKELPVTCYVTGKDHLSYVTESNSD